MITKIAALLLLYCSVIFSSFAQTAKDLMLNAHLDLIKSDHDGYFEKVQSGVEVNYFISQHFTATAGAELWTNNISAVVGVRWYPMADAFVRLRGLIGENDISIGGGWAKPINKRWKFEAIGDFYFASTFAIRAGVAYRIQQQP
jgi:hypothetical protein